MVIYQCLNCGKESGYTELDSPKCRYCGFNTSMVEISRKKFTAEVMAARLKQLTDSMFKNLQSAFEVMTDEDKKHFPDDMDPEKEMLLLLEKAKKLKENVQNLELKEPDSGKKPKKKK